MMMTLDVWTVKMSDILMEFETYVFLRLDQSTPSTTSYAVYVYPFQEFNDIKKQ